MVEILHYSQNEVRHVFLFFHLPRSLNQLPCSLTEMYTRGENILGTRVYTRIFTRTHTFLLGHLLYFVSMYSYSYYTR